MNLLCPHCQQMLTASDQYAGQIMKCPHCGNTFTAPSLPNVPPRSAAPAAPPPPAGAAATSAESVPRETAAPASPSPAPGGTSAPETVGATIAGPGPAPTPLSTTTTAPGAGYTRVRTLWVSPRVVPWIAPVCLVLVFLLSFFSWLRIFNLDPPTELVEHAWTVAFRQGNTLLAFYLVLLILALLITLAAVVLPRVTAPLPLAVRQILPWRSGIVAGAILITFLFLFIQLLKGFHEEDTEWAAFLVRRTVWLRLAVTLHLLALLGAVLEFWLVLRKNRPLPRVDVSW